MRFWFKFHVSKNIFSKNIKYLNQLLTSGVLRNTLQISRVLEGAWKKGKLKPAELLPTKQQPEKLSSVNKL